MRHLGRQEGGAVDARRAPGGGAHLRRTTRNDGSEPRAAASAVPPWSRGRACSHCDETGEGGIGDTETEGRHGGGGDGADAGDTGAASGAGAGGAAGEALVRMVKEGLVCVGEGHSKCRRGEGGGVGRRRLWRRRRDRGRCSCSGGEDGHEGNVLRYDDDDDDDDDDNGGGPLPRSGLMFFSLRQNGEGGGSRPAKPADGAEVITAAVTALVRGGGGLTSAGLCTLRRHPPRLSE